jgi:hypothetical protein
MYDCGNELTKTRIQMGAALERHTAEGCYKAAREKRKVIPGVVVGHSYWSGDHGEPCFELKMVTPYGATGFWCPYLYANRGKLSRESFKRKYALGTVFNVLTGYAMGNIFGKLRPAAKGRLEVERGPQVIGVKAGNDGSQLGVLVEGRKPRLGVIVCCQDGGGNRGRITKTTRWVRFVTEDLMIKASVHEKGVLFTKGYKAMKAGRDKRKLRERTDVSMWPARAAVIDQTNQICKLDKSCKGPALPVPAWVPKKATLDDTWRLVETAMWVDYPPDGYVDYSPYQEQAKKLKGTEFREPGNGYGYIHRGPWECDDPGDFLKRLRAHLDEGGYQHVKIGWAQKMLQTVRGAGRMNQYRMIQKQMKTKWAKRNWAEGILWDDYCWATMLYVVDPKGVKHNITPANGIVYFADSDLRFVIAPQCLRMWVSGADHEFTNMHSAWGVNVSPVQWIEGILTQYWFKYTDKPGGGERARDRGNKYHVRELLRPDLKITYARDLPSKDLVARAVDPIALQAKLLKQLKAGKPIETPKAERVVNAKHDGVRANGYWPMEVGPFAFCCTCEDEIVHEDEAWQDKDGNYFCSEGCMEEY